MDELEWGRFHERLVFGLGTIWVFDGYEVSLLSVAGLEIKDELGLNISQIGLLGSGYLLGSTLGAIIFSLLSLRLGRK